MTISRPKRLLTSNFARIRALADHGHSRALIPIVRHLPSWLPGEIAERNQPRLAPPTGLLAAAKQGRISWQQYELRFDEAVLGGLDQDRVYDALVQGAGGQLPVLLCYCKGKDGHCHRHLVARWLDGAGYQCSEWSPPSLQMTLFG